MLLQEMTWPEIGNLSRDIPVVVPVAALEQHGHHMPVFTDSLLVGEVVRRVGAAMSDHVLIATISVTRAPKMRRLSTSRPRWSVPRTNRPRGGSRVRA
jgi:creatinine amidohydrolase/Fe(II)-dependent formamide hydrolase-like protein